MSKLKESKTAKAVAGFVGLVTAVMMVGPMVASADAVSDLQAQIASLLAQINSLNAQLATVQGGSTGGACTYTFATNLKQGMTGTDVMNLQKVLNMSADTQVSASGAGSPGHETSYFGPATKAAVIKFQNKYASDILTPVGLKTGTGYVGASTRAKLNAMCTTTTTTTTTGTTTGGTTGTTTAASMLTVSNTTQPANSLAPQNSSRVPFTKFTVTAGSSDVTVTGVNVERSGLAQDAVFSGVVLLDENGTQIGTSKTFNSNHQATIGDTFTVKAGTSKTLTVAGNMASSLGSYAGQVASISVTGLNTSATISGSFPITGAAQTINATLTIGTVSTSTSSFDPGSAQTKNIGDTNIRFSGVRFTAGSGEDLKLYSVRWRQTGSVSSSDLGNLMTNANGTDYPTTVDSTGKYYTSNFPGGITIAKGNSIDVYIHGDLIGSGSAGRTADFDIDKVTDVYFVGQLYGYGVAPSGTYTPWYNGYVFTINAGSATTISNATEVPAQNIAINVPNQPLGGFATSFAGEPVSVTNMVFHLNYSSGSATTYPITSISLYDQNGAVVAGPVDAVAVAGTDMTATFTDTVTFPASRMVYTIKGKIPSGVSNNVTVLASTTPSGWSSPTGQTSGNSVTISQGNFSMNTMTIRAGAMNVALSATPGSQTIVSNGNGILFANVQLDASQSGEDVRISTIPLRVTSNTGLSSCQLYDGSTVLNTGSHVPTTYNTGATPTNIALDNSLIVPKGTVKTIAVKCNLSSGSGSYQFSVNSGDTWTVTGQTSGSSITSTFGNLTGGTMTIGTASLVVSTDPSSPAYTIAAAGTTGVTLGSYQFTATNDSVNLTRIGLSMGTVTASSSPADLTQVTLWNGATQIGTATFVGTNRTATSTLTTPVTVPNNGSVTIIVKGNLATQGASQPSNPGALLTVNVDTNGASGNKNTTGTGVGSGTTVDPSGTTSVSGVRVFASFPTVARSTYNMSSTLVAQSGIDLYRFTIGANSADSIALSQLTVNVATSSVSTNNGTTSVTNLKVYAYTGSDFATGPVAGYTAGQIVNTIANLANGNNTATLSSVLTIPAGTTYYFRVVGDVAQVAGTTGSAGSVTTKLSGDTAYPALPGLMGTSTGVISGFGNTGLFIWSPMSTSTTASNNNVDWTNSFNVPGISSGNTDAWTLSK